MKIEKIRLRNFRCFGDEVIELKFEENLTTLVGGNGSGKTAVLQAVSRLFGTSSAQRSVQRRDFHIPVDRQELQTGAQLFIEAILGFPELAKQENSSHNAVPEFFNQMSASGEGEPLKVRIRLQATWMDDGTPEGAIEEEMRWILSLNEDFSWEECPRIQADLPSSLSTCLPIVTRRHKSHRSSKVGFGRLPNGRCNSGTKVLKKPGRSRLLSVRKNQRNS